MILMVRQEISEQEIALETARQQVVRALFEVEECRQVERHIERLLDKLRDRLERLYHDEEAE